MKANAPEKIYIPRLEGNETFVHEWSATKFRKYFSREIAENVEYVRKDAFIEKAYSWLKNHYRDYMHNPTGERLEAFFGGDMCNDFEDYMKGE